MVDGVTAFISHDVYNKGIQYYFDKTGRSGNGSQFIIALLNNDGKAIAISGVKYREDIDDDTDEGTDCFLKLSNFAQGGEGASFENKQLKIPYVDFNYTRSLVSEGSENAYFFAIIDVTEGSAPTDGFQPTLIQSGAIKYPAAITGSSVLVQDTSTGLATLANLPVVIFGSLSNHPSIDPATNFYFSGATIEFTEAAN